MKEKTKINNNKKHLKIIAIVLMIIVFTSLGTLYAKTNGNYATDTVNVEFVNDVMNNNALASPIGGFLLFIGGLIEWALGAISQVVSGGGDTVMPWADAILFNAVPILDVNFMNPDPNSIVSQLSSVISSIYNVVLGLAIIFFSFAVMLMAVKLAVSSIAAEKARYKDALSNWALGLVMLFTVHYLISFIFFLNEGMVEVASNIVTTQIKDTKFVLNSEQDTVNILNKYINNEESNGTWEELFGAVDLKGTTISSNFAKGQNFFVDIINDTNYQEKYLREDTVMYNVSNWFLFKGSSFNKAEATKVLNRINELYTTIYDLSDNEYEELKLADNKDKREKILNKLLPKTAPWHTVIHQGQGMPDDIGEISSIYTSDNGFVVSLVDYHEKYGNEAEVSSDYSYPITMMAEYFRKNSYVRDNPEVDLTADEIYLPNAIMYVIFVVQSMLYFFSYLKRLFYVIILAVMAPVIVVFDFFNKI
jgi:hypothetical protein